MGREGIGAGCPTLAATKEPRPCPFSLTTLRKDADNAAPARLSTQAGQPSRPSRIGGCWPPPTWSRRHMRDSDGCWFVRYTDAAGVDVATLGDNGRYGDRPQQLLAPGPLPAGRAGQPRGATTSVRAVYSVPSPHQRLDILRQRRVQRQHAGQHRRWHDGAAGPRRPAQLLWAVLLDAQGRAG